LITEAVGQKLGKERNGRAMNKLILERLFDRENEREKEKERERERERERSILRRQYFVAPLKFRY